MSLPVCQSASLPVCIKLAARQTQCSILGKTYHIGVIRAVVSAPSSLELMSSWSGERRSNQRASYPVEIVWASEELSTLLLQVSCWSWIWVWIETVSSPATSGKGVCQRRAKLQARKTVFNIRQDISRWGHQWRGTLTPRILHFQLAHQVLSRQGFERMFSWSGIRSSNQRTS